MSHVIPDKTIRQFTYLSELAGKRINPDAKLEFIALALWCAHMSIMNSGRGAFDQRSLQEHLQGCALGYVSRFLGNEYSFDSDNDRRTAVVLSMELIQQRAEEYNIAFNKDKIVALDPSTTDADMGYNICDHFLRQLPAPLGLSEKRFTVVRLLNQLLGECIGALR